MNVVITSESEIDDLYCFRLKKRENCINFKLRKNSDNLFRNRQVINLQLSDVIK